MPREVICRECRGNGWDRGMPWTSEPCEDCGGTGRVYAPAPPLPVVIKSWGPDARASLLRGEEWLALCKGIACPVDSPEKEEV